PGRVCGTAPRARMRPQLSAEDTSMSRSKSYLTRRQRAGFRPRLEMLEDRTAPAVFTVTNTADTGPGSLRQAGSEANAARGADTITFDPAAFATPKTITLTTGELRVTDSVTIAGPGAALATVSGNNTSRVFHMEGSGTLDVTLSALTVTKGQAPTVA